MLQRHACHSCPKTELFLTLDLCQVVTKLLYESRYIIQYNIGFLYSTIVTGAEYKSYICIYLIHNRHPIPRADGRAMSCLLWGFWRKLTAVYFSSCCSHHALTHARAHPSTNARAPPYWHNPQFCNTQWWVVSFGHYFSHNGFICISFSVKETKRWL